MIVELSAGVASLPRLETVAVFVMIVPTAAQESTLTTMSKSVVEPAPRLEVVHEIDPVAPTAGVEQLHSVGAEIS